MPRVHIKLQGIEEIEELEQQDDWEQQPGLYRDARGGLEERARERGERRFGGSEVIARKRADRRKTSVRAARRV